MSKSHVEILIWNQKTISVSIATECPIRNALGEQHDIYFLLKKAKVIFFSLFDQNVIYFLTNFI